MTDRQYLHSLLVLLIGALMLAWMGRYTDFDLQLSDWMYDPAQGDFPWRHKWLAAVFVHQWMNYFFIGLGAACALMLVGDMAFGWHGLSSATRRKLAAVVGTAVVVPTTVSFLKHLSVYHCPWDVARYGGFAPYLRPFEQVVEGIRAGHCFPAGHASGALWLSAFAIFWLPERVAVAAAVFVLGLVPGLVMGWVQQMRGAHFLSHTLWSVWIATLAIVIFARCVHRPP